MRWRDRQSEKQPPQQSPKARRGRQGTRRCAAAESTSRRQRREHRGGRAGTREREGWRPAHTETPAPAKRSLFWRSNYPSHRCVWVCVCGGVCVCVCVRAHGRACVCVEREKKRECVCYPKAPGPRSPRGRQINLAAPPQGGRPPALGHRAAGAGCHNRPCHGPRAVRGAGKPAPTPTGEIDWASNPGPAARVPQSTRGGARQGRDATRLSSPTLPWAPQPLMPRGPGVPVPALW